ncbi:hypothetical protein BU15DRAFT_82798 [Melanogaster broomeanus]|nr:hypothetical protein BU15DRAFT_82798 [Melanogaster broomeanus]
MTSYDSRQYVDRILAKSFQWANWDPTKTISVGDFGTISKETGEFLREGSIYSEDFQKLISGATKDVDEGDPHSVFLQHVLREWEEKIDLKDAIVQPEVSAGDPHQIISSSNGHPKDPGVAPDVDVQNQANAGLQVNFGFGDKGGVVLALYQTQKSSFSTADERLASVLKLGHKAVKERYFVTEVVSCLHTCWLFPENESFSASLSATVTSGVPEDTVGKDAGLAWSHDDMVNGVCRSGSNANFVPLFQLRQPRRGFWSFLKYPGQRGFSLTEPLEWENVRAPWDWLDLEGKELERYDPTMYSDEEPDWEIECEQ